MTREKILLVEDGTAKETIYRETLEKSGYEILDAKNGIEGMNMAQKNSPDVIIADLVTCKTDNFDLIEALKKNEKTKYMPIICISRTYKDIKSKLKALTESGVEEFFYMPEHTAELLVKVQVMIRIRKIYLELLEKNRQLVVFNRAVIDRELKMTELKDRVKALEAKLTRYKNEG